MKLFRKKKTLKIHMENVVKGLNDLTITNPELAGQFNKVTDMLERKLKEIPEKDLNKKV